MVTDVATAAALGIGLGIVTGLPIGIVNVAIVDAAVRGERRFAGGIGVGGALADTVHACVAFLGVGHVVTTHPGWSRAIAIVGAAAIVAFVIASALRRRAVAVPRRAATGIATGLALTLPNPAALAAWIAVAAAWPAIEPAAAIALGVGVGIWVLYRIIRGWMTLSSRRAMPA